MILAEIGYEKEYDHLQLYILFQKLKEILKEKGYKCISEVSQKKIKKILRMRNLIAHRYMVVQMKDIPNFEKMTVKYQVVINGEYTKQHFKLDDFMQIDDYKRLLRELVVIYNQMFEYLSETHRYLMQLSNVYWNMSRVFLDEEFKIQRESQIKRF